MGEGVGECVGEGVVVCVRACKCTCMYVGVLVWVRVHECFLDGIVCHSLKRRHQEK